MFTHKTENCKVKPHIPGMWTMHNFILFSVKLTNKHNPEGMLIWIAEQMLTKTVMQTKYNTK